ncbi:MAG TPA: hypothetical protein VIY48_11915 [Candidatus Paceibacterota bacterium]
MRFRLPRSQSRKMSEMAVLRAREYGDRRGWHATRYLEPVVAKGTVGIKIARQYMYLLYQNDGTRPRVMYELEGKFIPMKSGGRRAKGVGQPGWVTLPGGVRVFRQQKWRHPGIKPTHFLEEAIEFAIKKNKKSLQDWMMAIVDPNRSNVITKADASDATRRD